MDLQKAAQAFNQWMQDYTDNPEAFEDIRKSAARFLAERQDGLEPSYGERCGNARCRASRAVCPSPEQVQRQRAVAAACT